MQNSIFHLIKIKVALKFFWATHFKKLQVNLHYLGPRIKEMGMEICC
jgi:hypothetical protein